MISHVKLKEMLDYNPETGIFTWKVVSNNRLKVGAVAGTLKDGGYIQIAIGGSLYYSGPLAWFYMTGKWSEYTIDHENRNRSDDRWTNLREATPSQNNSNRSMQRNNTSGYRGVSWDRPSQKWDARVNRVRIGLYDDLMEAVAARDAAAIELQGSFAQLNQ